MNQKNNQASAKKKESVKEEKKFGENQRDYFADLSGLEIGLKEMLKGGVHFGHQKSRRHPEMEKYIFSTCKGINIINLQRTFSELKKALDFIKELRQEGKQILFVGTKKQAKEMVVAAAKSCKMPFVARRWLGGTFTNFKVIRGRAKYLRDSQEKLAKGEFKKYTKFEQVKKMEELEKLENKMGGIKNMVDFPGAIVVVGVKEDYLAIKEAKIAGIPIIALVDTDNDPTLINYPIPANDDAVSSIKLMLGYICRAILENKNIKKNEKD